MTDIAHHDHIVVQHNGKFEISPTPYEKLMIGDAAAAVDLHLKLKDRQIDFTLQRFQESDQEREKVWKIRILHPNKRIDRCNVWFQNNKLRLWDSTDSFIRTIEEGGGANFVVPKGTIDEYAGVVIKAFDKVIKRVKFRDIEITKP